MLLVFPSQKDFVLVFRGAKSPRAQKGSLPTIHPRISPKIPQSYPQIPLQTPFLIPCRWILRVVDSSPPPAPVRAPLAERPGSAVRRCNRSRADGAEPRPPNWPAQRRSLLLVGSGVAMPVPRPAPPVSTTFANGAPQGFLWSFAPVSLAGGLLSAVAGFPLCAAFVRRSRFPLLWRWFRETLSEHRVGGRQQEQRVSANPPQRKEKHRKSLWKPAAGVAALPVCWLRPPPLLVVPALRVLVLPLLPAFAAVAPGSLGREFGEMALTFTM